MPMYLYGCNRTELVDPGKFRTNLIGEDARIFSLNGNLHLVYNNHLTRYKRVFMAEIFFLLRDDMFYALHPQNYIRFEHIENSWHEKNWTPFEYCPHCAFDRGSVAIHKSGHHRAHLLFVYSIQPHIIVQAYHTNVSGEMVAERIFTSKLKHEDEWQYGTMRG